MRKYSQLKIRKITPKVETQPVIDTDVWSIDTKLAAALAAFEARTPELHEEGIEVTNLPVGLNLLNDDIAAQRLVTRREQRTVIERAFNRSREMLATDSVAVNEGKKAKSVLLAIRGSPGIGKSWSSLLYLKHLLKDKKRPIIFESGPFSTRMKRLLVFDTTTGSWTAYKLTVTDHLPEDWYQFSGKDVIVDPPQFPQGMMPQSSALVYCMGHILIPVSLDNSHLGGTHKTSAYRKQFVLGPWTLREIEVAWPQMVYLRRPSEEEYQERAKLVRERYGEFGGLPRYLINAEKARERRHGMTPANAKTHEKLLLSALATAQINDNKNVVTLFFTLYPGVNENGDYDPSIEYSTVEFVSRGALKAAGKVVFDQINSDVTWRYATDASSIGLAFEAVCSMLDVFAHGDTGHEGHGNQLMKGDEPRHTSLYEVGASRKKKQK